MVTTIPTSDAPQALEAVRVACPELDQDAAIGAIRARVPIDPDDALAITVQQRNDPSVPDAVERDAVRRWDALVQACQAQAVARAGTQPSFLLQSWDAEHDLRLAFAAGSMSYGEFRRARWDLLERRRAEIEQMARVLDAVIGRSTLSAYNRLPWWAGGDNGPRIPIIIFIPVGRR